MNESRFAIGDKVIHKGDVADFADEMYSLVREIHPDLASCCHPLEPRRHEVWYRLEHFGIVYGLDDCLTPECEITKHPNA